MGVRWSDAELSEYIASGRDVAFFDRQGRMTDPPARLAGLCAGRPEPLWDGMLSSVHAPDRPGLMRFKNASVAAPGRVQQVDFHTRSDGVWHRLRARLVNLLDQPDVGVTVGLVDPIESLPDFAGALESRAPEATLWARTRCDAGGTFLDIEGTVEAIYGAKPEDLIGTNSIDLVHPDDLHLFHKGQNHAYAAPGESSVQVIRIRRPDGAYVPIIYTAVMTPDLDECRSDIYDAAQLVKERLHEAMAADELQLAYQPVVDLDSGRVLGAEALLRWIHPTRGLIPPMDFIPLAEATDAVVAVGAWVLHEACREAATWPGHLSVAVNVSVRQLADPAIVGTVAAALDSSGLTPDRLTLEVTETAVMEKADQALAHLRALAELGVDLAIDDFGTGFSSLQYLSRMPVDCLKVDRSFVSDLGRPEGDAIVRSVIALAHALDLRIVAEGVETEGQRGHLAALGADLAQGYLWSRPVAAEEFRSYAAATTLALTS